MRIVSRAEWRARTPTSSTLLELPVCRVFFALTNTGPCSYPATCAHECRALQRFHRVIDTRQDIRFNFLIGGDGLVYEGRGWDATPSLGHKYAGQEYSSIYIGCIGKKYSPDNDVLFQLVDEFVKYGVENKYIIEDHKLKFIECDVK